MATEDQTDALLECVQRHLVYVRLQLGAIQHAVQTALLRVTELDDLCVEALKKEKNDDQGVAQQ